MAQVSKNDVNQIFANDAPASDKPPSFNNYTQGWNESRTNNGKPTIKQMNFLQQRNDNNVLWIHQNGGALPYDTSIEYADGALVLKDGKLQQLDNGKWLIYGSSDSDIITWSGKTQNEENKSFITTVNSLQDLDTLPTSDGRTTYVRNLGIYRYDVTQSKWLPDDSIEKSLTSILTIDDLDDVVKYDGRVVYVKSFYAPDYARSTPYLGGAYYIYNSASVSQSDGLFNRNGWILQFDTTVNIYQLGFKGDATTDETALLRNVVSTIKNLVRNSYKNKIILDGSLSYLMLSDNVTIDLCYVGLRNLRFKALDTFKPTVYTSLITYITTDSWADVPLTLRKDFNIIHDNVNIICPDSRDFSIGLITAPNAVVPMSDASLKGLTISGFKYGLVFDENSYLLSFYNPRIQGQYCAVTTTFSLGINTGDQSNMGENIRFFGGTIASVKKVFEMLKGNGIGMHYFGTSLDYNGGNASTGYETWFEFMVGSSEFSFFGCHWEAGNENAGLKRMFHLGYRTKITIVGGEMLFKDDGYNSCDYFCYNEELGQISIEGTRIFAPSVKYWANKGLAKFTPMFNSPDNGEVCITSDYTKSLAFDPNMQDSAVTDIIVAGGYTDNVLESSQVKISKGTVSINGANTNVIQIYKKNGQGSVDAFDIYIPRKSTSNCVSSCAMKMFLTNGSSNANEVSYSFSLVKSRQLNSQGVPIELAGTLFSESSWKIDTGATWKEVTATSLRVGDAYKGYNYYKISCRLFNFQSQGTLNIVGLGFEETD